MITGYAFWLLYHHFIWVKENPPKRASFVSITGIQRVAHHHTDNMCKNPRLQQQELRQMGKVQMVQLSHLRYEQSLFLALPTPTTSLVEQRVNIHT